MLEKEGYDIVMATSTAALPAWMVKRYPELCFDFHAHNDYDLAVANVYSAVRAGVTGIHTTVNGLGERAGNAPLSSVIAVLKDQLKQPTHLQEKRINHVSRLVETYSGIHIPPLYYHTNAG